MSDNKTKTANQAKAALGVTPNVASPEDAWWVDTLKQQYLTITETAVSLLNDKKPNTARLRFAQASALCDALSIFFRYSGLNEAADLWANRAVRQHRLAFGRKNTIAEGIGASMP